MLRLYSSEYGSNLEHKEDGQRWKEYYVKIVHRFRWVLKSLEEKAKNPHSFEKKESAAAGIVAYRV